MLYRFTQMGIDMPIEEAIAELLERACPSIQYRVRLEILRQSPYDPVMLDLQHQILCDPLVQEVLSWQQPDGWLGWYFHGSPGAEPGIRILCEKGVDHHHPALVAALQALETYTDRLERGISKVGKILDDQGLGGSSIIRAALFAHAGIEDKVLVTEQIAIAVEAFNTVRAVHAIADIVDTYRGKLVFKPGVKWPGIYDLRLLAFTYGWRTPENQTVVAESLKRLFDLSPIPDIYLRYKSQLIAPASVFMHDFRPDMATMDAATWMGWFHRTELLSRLGVVNYIGELQKQVNNLWETLCPNQGRFTRRLNHDYFKKWRAYPGLMLERDWKSPERRIYDLTFRSLLILHFSERLPAQ